MDTAEIIVLSGGVARIGFVLWFFFGARDEEPAHPGGTPVGVAIYACPMHSWITSSDPAAICSICGMKLVKRD